MLFGLPVELWAGVGSYALSAFNSLNKAKQDREERRHKFDMATMAASHKVNMDWFKAQNDVLKNDTHFAGTRRWIAIFMVVIVVGAMLVLPALLPGIPWIVEASESTSAFFGIFTDNTTSYTNIEGIYYQDWMGSAVMSIIGFYFGSKAGK